MFQKFILRPTYYIGNINFGNLWCFYDGKWYLISNDEAIDEEGKKEYMRSFPVITGISLGLIAALRKSPLGEWFMPYLNQLGAAIIDFLNVNPSDLRVIFIIIMIVLAYAGRLWFQNRTVREGVLVEELPSDFTDLEELIWERRISLASPLFLTPLFIASPFYEYGHEGDLLLTFLILLIVSPFLISESRIAKFLFCNKELHKRKNRKRL